MSNGCRSNVGRGAIGIRIRIAGVIVVAGLLGGATWCPLRADGAAPAEAPANTSAVEGSLAPAPLRTVQGGRVAYSPDGHTLASGAFDTVHLWDAETGAEKLALKTDPAAKDRVVAGIAFSPDGKTVAAGSYDGGVTLWDVATGTLIRTINAHPDSAPTVAFTPDGVSLVTGGAGHVVDGDHIVKVGEVKIWNVASGANTAATTLRGPLSLAVGDLVVSRDGGEVACTSAGEDVYVLDLPSLQQKYQLNTNDLPLAAAFSADGKSLLTGALDLERWDMATGRLTFKLPMPEPSMAQGSAFSPDGLTFAEGDSGQIRLHDADTLWELATFAGPGRSLAYSPDGRLLAGGEDETRQQAEVWDLAALRLPAARSWDLDRDSIGVVDDLNVFAGYSDFQNAIAKAAPSERKRVGGAYVRPLRQAVAAVAIANGRDLVFSSDAVAWRAASTDIGPQVLARVNHTPQTAAAPVPAGAVVLATLDEKRLAAGYTDYQKAVTNLGAKPRADVDMAYMNKAQAALEQLATENKLTLVLRKSVLAVSDPAADLTGELLARLNGKGHAAIAFRPATLSALGVLDDERLTADYTALNKALEDPKDRQPDDIDQEFAPKQDAALEQVATSRNMRFVLHRNQLLLSAPWRDITGDVLAKLNG